MTSNNRRRITALFLVAVMIGSPFATAMAGASSPPGTETVNVTDNVDVWAGSPFTLQTQTDGATTINDVPETMSIGVGAFSSEPALQPVRIFNPGTTVDFSYGSNEFDPATFDSDLNNTNTQVHIIKLNESVSEENVDASMIPGSPSELGDLLSTEDVNSNATFTNITSEVGPITNEFNFDHQFSEPGLYTVLITSNAGAGSGIQLDGNNIGSINGEINVIGLEPVAVQDNSGATVSLESSSEPGDNLTFDVESGGLGSNTNHVVAVYEKSTLKNENIVVETPSEIDDTTTADEFTITSNIGAVSGEAILKNDVELLGQTLGATTRNNGPFSVENIINRIADEASTETPELATDEVTLFASVTGVVGSSSEEVTVNTTDWDEGDYRVVYMATSGDSSDEFISAERTITIEPDTSGGNDDDGNGGGSSGGSSGGISDNDDEEDDTTQDDDAQDDDAQDDTPTVEDVREELDRTGPSRETNTEIIDNDPDTPGVTVTPEGTQSVRQITFQGESASGTVTIREYDEPPESLSESVTASLNRQQTNNADSDGSNSETQPTTRRARVVSVSDISPDSASANGPATIVMTVDRDRFENPENAVVFHERGETWEELPTTIEDAGDGEVTVTAETDSFSLFAVAEVEEPLSTTETTTESQEGSTEESEGGLGTGAIIGVLVVLSLIAAILFAYSRQ